MRKVHKDSPLSDKRKLDFGRKDEREDLIKSLHAPTKPTSLILSQEGRHLVI